MQRIFERVSTGRTYRVPVRDAGRYERSPNFREVLPEPDHVCECGFEAKTAGGLGSHQRTHDEG